MATWGNNNQKKKAQVNFTLLWSNQYRIDSQLLSIQIHRLFCLCSSTAGVTLLGINEPENENQKYRLYWTSLVVQWVRLHASTAGGTGSVSRGESKISCHGQKKKAMSSAMCSVPPFRRCFRREGEAFPGGEHGGRARSWGKGRRASVYDAFRMAAG